MIKFLMTIFLMLVECSSWAGSPTFNAIPINSDNNPRGYWEFLPSDYLLQPNSSFPVVVFFHGLEEGGNGNEDLDEVLLWGPPKMVNADIDNNVFEANQVIMLAPQVTNNTWWNDGHIRPFLNYVLKKYRIDENRIYFTGLSAGSSGINDFMDDDSESHQITAATLMAVRGVVSMEGGGYLAPLVPYWGLTAIGDASNTVINSVNNIAGFFNNGMPTDVMANYPNAQIDRTAHYLKNTGWVWEEGINHINDVSPKVTLYPGSSHLTWEVSYNNLEVWQWLFSQVKPNVEITSPQANSVYTIDDDISFMASATDLNGQPINDFSWSSSIDGYLGTGHLTTRLSAGMHEIEIVAADQGHRGKIVTTAIEVVFNDIIFINGFDGN